MINFVDTVTSDPETDGKKDGYERAANEYELIMMDDNTDIGLSTTIALFGAAIRSLWRIQE